MSFALQMVGVGLVTALLIGTVNAFGGTPALIFLALIILALRGKI